MKSAVAILCVMVLSACSGEADVDVDSQRWWDLFDGNEDNMIDASEWRARTGAA